MSGLLGGPKSPKVNAVSAITFQSSAHGQPVPLLYGTNRISGNVVDYRNFHSSANMSGGDKDSHPTGTYSYYVSVLFGVADAVSSASGQASGGQS